MAFIQDRFKLSLEALSEAVLGRLGGSGAPFWSSLGALLEPLERLLYRLGKALREEDDF